MSGAAMTCADVRELAGLFVLGALEPAEMAAVRTHLATCDQPHPEIAELGGVVGHHADLADPIEPRAEVGARIAAAVRALPAPGSAVRSAPEPVVASVPAASAAEPTPLDERRFLAASRRRRWAVRSLLAIAAAAVVALGGLSLSLQGQLDTQESIKARLELAIAAANQPGSVTAPVTGSGVAAEATGLLVLPASGARYLVMTGLPAVPAGKTYQAWYIRGSTPTSAGVFQAGSQGLTVWDGASAPGSAQLFALTIESPGATQPTMQPIAVATIDQ